MDGIEVERSSERLAAALAPLRRRLLAALDEPDSAAGLARRLDLPRQKVNYHLRALEELGLVELAGERQRRGFTERLLRRTSRAVVVDPDVLGGLRQATRVLRDRFSSAWLVALTARVLHEVGLLRQRADEVDQALATVALDADVRFATPGDLRAFADGLQESVARLSARHGSFQGRVFRVTATVHPAVTKTAQQAAREAVTHRTEQEEQ